MKNTSIVSQVAPICKLKDILDVSAINGNLFVASATGFMNTPALVYPDNGFNNSDRVRAAFAKRNGIKFTAVRCCRLKNANK
jgi:hypothetical protein